VLQAEETIQTEYRALEIAKLFPLQGEWTEEDYFNLPDKNYLVELSDRRIIIQDMPGDDHQRVLLNLAIIIHQYVKQNNLGEIRTSPLPVRLWKNKIREPDIIFMSNEHKDRIQKDSWGVPDLAIELISVSNEHVDRIEKFDEYAQAGIPEYWIVEPIDQTIEVFTLEQGNYVLLGKSSIGDIVYSKIIDGFEVNVVSVM